MQGEFVLVALLPGLAQQGMLLFEFFLLYPELLDITEFVNIKIGHIKDVELWWLHCVVLPQGL